MNDNNPIYCNKCILREDYAGVSLNEKGQCNCCSDTLDISVKNYKEALRNYKEFVKNSSQHEDGYDCLVMFSGGKDSYYLLWQIITEHKFKPLAFTMNSPFESDVAHKNIKTACNKLNFDHIHFTPNLNMYQQVMQKAFSFKRDEPELFDERTPCTVCGLLTQIHGFIFAYKFGIPYIVYANDPLQLLSINYNILTALEKLMSVCGERLVYELFDEKLIKKILATDPEDLPTFVMPYVAMIQEYDAEKIIKKLKELELYEGDSIQTYCSLVPLLNHYSFEKYDTPFFAHVVSQEIRVGDNDREAMLKFYEEYKKVILDIATKKVIADVDKDTIQRVLRMKYSTDEQAKLETEYKNILAMRETAEKIGISI